MNCARDILKKELAAMDAEIIIGLDFNGAAGVSFCEGLIVPRGNGAQQSYFCSNRKNSGGAAATQAGMKTQTRPARRL
jgi:hypothetical protein